ncbi:thermonuclease family protein [Bacillus sp. ISL-47]|uniref:thermonuclease family protein n=1 Tax=Bacillus sp. ISL-47 TaxID=2819130 RepID=UPI001BEB1E36|nr:thermonuclease family protein [Pseudomonas sp. ISL-84]
MKVLRGVFFTIIILFMLLLGIVTPAAFIGLVVFLIGLFLNNQYRRFKTNFNKSGWIMAAGMILSIFLAVAFSETTETVTDQDIEEDTKQEETAKEEQRETEEKQQAEEDKLAEEEEAKKQAEEKARLEAEKAEKEKQEEAERQQKEEEQIAASLGLELVTIGRVVDGDTVETSDGRKVRLIGINTPESTTKDEEYGKEASQYTSSKLTGKKVWMQKDVSDTDRYGRLLRIIWLEIPSDDMDETEMRTKMFNAHLVLNGFAEPSTYNPDVKYSEFFRKFGREAREASKGLWAFGNEGTTRGDLDSSGSSSAGGSSSGSGTGNISSGSETDSSSSSNSASSSSENQSESYKNCTELRKVYPNGVPSTHPAYDSKHDRDKDDFACER